MPYSNSFSSKQPSFASDKCTYSRSNPLYRASHNTSTARFKARPQRTHKTHRPRTTHQRVGLAFVIVLAFALMGAGAFAISTLGSLAHTNNPSLSSEHISTPQREWQKGRIPALYQQDPAWAQGSYGGDSFGKSGCGPTCLSMVYIGLTGKDTFTPADAGILSENLGLASPEGTAWAYMTEGATTMGLIAEELPATESALRQALRAGKPVICSVGPGDFTSTGHFIVLYGINEHGNLLICDPNSPERTGKTWEFNTVLPQCLNIWAYSLAA